eukprot:Clim_evm5s246 gene=Clim_evmTU5s246
MPDQEDLVTSEPSVEKTAGGKEAGKDAEDSMETDIQPNGDHLKENEEAVEPKENGDPTLGVVVEERTDVVIEEVVEDPVVEEVIEEVVEEIVEEPAPEISHYDEGEAAKKSDEDQEKELMDGVEGLEDATGPTVLEVTEEELFIVGTVNVDAVEPVVEEATEENDEGKTAEKTDENGETAESNAGTEELVDAEPEREAEAAAGEKEEVEADVAPETDTEPKPESELKEGAANTAEDAGQTMDVAKDVQSEQVDVVSREILEDMVDKAVAKEGETQDGSPAQKENADDEATSSAGAEHAGESAMETDDVVAPTASSPAATGDSALAATAAAAAAATAIAPETSADNEGNDAMDIEKNKTNPENGKEPGNADDSMDQDDEDSNKPTRHTSAEDLAKLAQDAAEMAARVSMDDTRHSHSEALAAGSRSKEFRSFKSSTKQGIQLENSLFNRPLFSKTDAVMPAGQIVASAPLAVQRSLASVLEEKISAKSAADKRKKAKKTLEDPMALAAMKAAAAVKRAKKRREKKEKEQARKASIARAAEKRRETWEQKRKAAKKAEEKKKARAAARAKKLSEKRRISSAADVAAAAALTAAIASTTPRGTEVGPLGATKGNNKKTGSKKKPSKISAKKAALAAAKMTKKADLAAGSLSQDDLQTIMASLHHQEPDQMGGIPSEDANAFLSQMQDKMFNNASHSGIPATMAQMQSMVVDGPQRDSAPGKKSKHDKFSAAAKPAANGAAAAAAAAAAVPATVVSPRDTKASGKGPKKPQGAYMFFMKAERQRLVQENPGASFSEIQKLGGKVWNSMPAKEKAKYEKLATADKERYKREMAAVEAGNAITSSFNVPKGASKKAAAPLSAATAQRLCRTCGQAEASDKNLVTCDGPCMGKFHPKCVGLTAEAIKVLQNSSAVRAEWMCDDCFPRAG